MATHPKCPYCGKHAVKAYGSFFWPHKPELHHKKIWACHDCDARVGTHGNSWHPLGTLANEGLRAVRGVTHHAFDPLWKNGHFQRSELYAMLADHMKLDPVDCHIGMFDEDQCREVIEFVRWIGVKA